MTPSQWTGLAPLIGPAAAAVAVLLWISVRRADRTTALLAGAGLVVSLWLLVGAWDVAPLRIGPLLVMDGYAVFFLALLYATALAVLAITAAYRGIGGERKEELYLLLLLATLGAAVLVASTHFASFFLGLETLSIALYGMIAYYRRRDEGIEAGIKYLVLTGASSAILVFGMALVYAQTGTMEFRAIARAATGMLPAVDPMVGAGLALLFAGVGFKLAVVPFHLWTPDVYAGAPAPVGAFIATVSKGGVFALLLRLFLNLDDPGRAALFPVIGLVAAASMTVGNLLALFQHNVKRILAYSSIAHLGYLLVALLATSRLGVEAAAYYLAAYFATTVAAFGVVGLRSSDRDEAETLEAYRGLFWRRPGLSLVLTASMLSLAGIPLTGGFVAKFFVLSAGAGAALWTLVVFLAVNSAIGLYYYLRVILVMIRAPEEPGGETVPALPAAGGITLGILLVAIVWLGVLPGPLQRWIAGAVAGSF
ncbi:MAG: NADH-quinone oxidoreductase subunit NuoN [Candidatus Eisenbacteria bacterium]|nr:NADH-quinone oxidoreductase subunit NuoN [Candidatus Latescibacterota bacterium]MBD3303002.1 NADH-quinone oxidoreductase subunit NuoN [Candidatus Eisenbacteria bacterium]